MILTYVKGEEVTVWERARPGARARPYRFSPSCEIADSVAKRLLRNSRYRGWFDVPFVCGCGKQCKTKAALVSHKRVHKGETK